MKLKILAAEAIADARVLGHICHFNEQLEFMVNYKGGDRIWHIQGPPNSVRAL